MTDYSTVNRVDQPPADAPTVRLTDGLVAAIEREIASVPPERGGALVGVGSLAHLLVVDSGATYTAASWDISKALSETVGSIEAAGHGTLTGTVHSHPSQIADPSGTDVATMTLALEMNPHLDRLLIAIVTAGAPRQHDVAVGSSHRMSVHVLSKPGEQPVLRRATADVVPLDAELRGARIAVESSTSVDRWNADGGGLPLTVSVNRRPKLIVPTSSAPPLQALLVDQLHPIVSPLRVAVRAGDGGRLQLSPQPSPWDPSVPSGPQLKKLSQIAPAGTEGSLERVTELVGTLAGSAVAVVGAGSVGSRMAEDLVRCGVGLIVLVDPETVESPNLARSVYTTTDVGMPKTTALADRLRLINPDVEVRTHASTIAKIDPDEMLDGIHVVVAATDDMEEQAFLSHHAYARSIPLVACAIYRKGAAGEVVISLPSAGTACWACVAGAGSGSATHRPDSDYGLDGRLVGEAALGPAINSVASVASQIAVGLLAGPGTPSGRPIVRLLEHRRTLGVVSTTPEWEFFPDLFGGMGHQFQPQSVWPVVERRPECPVCGDHRRPPLSRDEGHRFVEDLAAVVQDERDRADSVDPQDSEESPSTDGKTEPLPRTGRIADLVTRTRSWLFRKLIK